MRRRRRRRRRKGQRGEGPRKEFGSEREKTDSALWSCFRKQLVVLN